MALLGKLKLSKHQNRDTHFDSFEVGKLFETNVSELQRDFCFWRKLSLRNPKLCEIFPSNSFFRVRSLVRWDFFAEHRFRVTALRRETSLEDCPFGAEFYFSQSERVKLTLLFDEGRTMEIGAEVFHFDCVTGAPLGPREERQLFGTRRKLNERTLTQSGCFQALPLCPQEVPQRALVFEANSTESYYLQCREPGLKEGFEVEFAVRWV